MLTNFGWGEGVGWHRRNLCTLLPTKKAKMTTMTTKLPLTQYLVGKEMRELLIFKGGSKVAQKMIDIALDDNHPGQMAAIKMCVDRTMPVSVFEREKSARTAVTINITGIGSTPVTIEADEPTEL